MQDLRKELAQLESQVAQHNSLIHAADLKIPALQTEKQIAVTARDFKKAGNSSKEMNALMESKKESQKQLEELKEKVTSCNAQLDERTARLSDIQVRCRAGH